MTVDTCFWLQQKMDIGGDIKASKYLYITVYSKVYYIRIVVYGIR